MKKFALFCLLPLFLLSCNKENSKGCWRCYDGILAETGVFCDKTKAEAKALPNNVFVCPADEKNYCWVLQNGDHVPCIPETIIADFCRYWGMSYTKESCSSTCRSYMTKSNNTTVAMLN